MATRIQRKRTKGWRMPEGAVYVGRPTPWGNPWKAGQWMSAENAIKNFRELIASRDATPNWRFTDIRSEDIKTKLRGKDLACWCPLDKPCHADVLLEIANKD